MPSIMQQTKIVKLGVDLVVITLSFLLAFAIRFDFSSTADQTQLLRQALPFVVAVRFLAHWLTSGYRPIWRYVSLHDLFKITGSSALSTLILAGTVWLPLPSSFSLPDRFPISVLVIDGLLNILLLLFARLFFRLYFTQRNARVLSAPSRESSRRILIIGAGPAAEQVARAARPMSHQGWQIIGFVALDGVRTGTLIHGIPILGRLSLLPDLLESHQIDEVLVAEPKLTGKPLSEVIQLCENSSARLLIIPQIDQLIEGTTPLQRLREIRLEDLLERDPVKLDTVKVQAFLTGQRVLITGGGGSIGREICRQILAMNPEMIIVLGRGENSIFEAMSELKVLTSEIRIIPIIASVDDVSRMRTVFSEFRPTVVFHAAAHKHVPFMESFPVEAIRNNVFGTANISNLSIEFGVKKFVLISTDKAVNPTSIMGASKRIAEMVIQSKSQMGQTEFVAVRFGNVLGSRGSVVPAMQRQIERGGPVEVTHPEMTRFFMTIPEAVQLVLQAASMGKSGEVFVLDMGQPVRIMDLARNLIRLSGKVPGQDIEIRIVGTRPGEKLYEEIFTEEEGVRATHHSRIFVTRGQVEHISRAEFAQLLKELEAAVAASDGDAIRRLLRQAIPNMVTSPVNG